MASAGTSFERHTRLEDVLDHLPISSTAHYRKGQEIYGPMDSSGSIHMVVAGTVGVSQIAEDGRELLLELVRPDELFGESAFLDVPRRHEKAIALERADLMTWPMADIDALVRKRPPLAMALLQFLARRNADLTRRIESLSIDSIRRRLARSLIRLSERLGTAEEDGSVRIMPFTHVMLSRYVGTSREIVTHHMNRFRREGHLNYSRSGIVVNRDKLKMVLNRQPEGKAIGSQESAACSARTSCPGSESAA